jgi:hypothetical protein
MTTIRRHPTATSYSLQYQRELPLPRLVWQARTAYQRAWARELERTPC